MAHSVDDDHLTDRLWVNESTSDSQPDTERAGVGGIGLGIVSSRFHLPPERIPAKGALSQGDHHDEGKEKMKLVQSRVESAKEQRVDSEPQAMKKICFGVPPSA